MKKISEFRRALSILGLFLGLSAIHLFIYAQNVSLKYHLTDKKILFSELSSQNRQLGSMVSREENLSQVEKIAKEKLGMIYPEKINYIFSSKEAY